MKYEIELRIEKPRSEVWQAFEDPEKIKVWQPSLSNVELVSGIRGQPGAQSKLTFQENEREYSLIEKITHREEAESIHQRYENQFAANTVKNTFREQGPDQTLWVTETDYRFKTLIMKVLGPLYKRNFAARAQRDMERFKAMVEGK